MIANIDTVSKEAREESIIVAEKVFETEAHPDQMQPTQETLDKLRALSPDTILYEVTPDNKLAGWVVIMPTTRELAEKFVNGEIGEQSFLGMTPPQDQYDAVYLCAVATLPVYRRQGVASKLTQEALKRLPLTPDVEYFAWPTTEEGKLTLKKFETETGKMVHIRT